MRKYHTADENILDFDISIRVGLHCSFLPGDRIKKRSRSGTVIGVHKNSVWVHWDSYLGAEPLEDVLETVLVCRYGILFIYCNSDVCLTSQYLNPSTFNSGFMKKSITQQLLMLNLRRIN